MAFLDVIDGIIKKGNNFDVRTVHEGEDGLLYCNKCNARRQMKINLLDQERIVPVMCDCMKAEEEREKKREFDKRVRQLRVDGLREEEDALCTFAADDRKNPTISDAVKRYADQWETMRRDNTGLLLYGPVGTGKTFYSACIANALIDRGIPVKMTNFARIVDDLQSDFAGRSDYLRRLNSYPLLIIDDLGIERNSEYMQEQVYNIVDARYASGRPLIVTTNVPLEEIKNPDSEQRKRIYDRILEICHPIKVDGQSRRRQAVRDKYSERNRLLGL